MSRTWRCRCPARALAVCGRSRLLQHVGSDLQAFDAVELLKRLRGVSDLDPYGELRTSAPAVLFVNAAPEPDDMEGLGVERVIRPPVELEDVVQVLHEVFAAWRQDNPDTPLADSANLAF